MSPQSSHPFADDKHTKMVDEAVRRLRASIHDTGMSDAELHDALLAQMAAGTRTMFYLLRAGQRIMIERASTVTGIAA